MIINEKDTCRVCDSSVHLVVDFGFKDMFVEKEWIERGGIMIFAMPDVEIIKGKDK